MEDFLRQIRYHELMFKVRKFFTRRNSIILGVLAVLLIGASIFIYSFVFYNLPSPTILKNYKSFPLSTHIYDRKGKLLYEVFRDQNRTPIEIKNLPPYVYQSSIAIEDKDFYKHAGISIISGVFRAARDTFLHSNLQGGSTITQQLVKGALLSPERTLQRKLKEITLALWAERIFTKDEILEMYLNQVPYGGSSYGVEEASKTYFGKHAKDLALSEAALLAGLPQSPSVYSPFINPEYAIERRNDVLQRMFEQGYINKEQKDSAVNTKLSFKPPSTDIRAPHFVFYVKSLLENDYGTQEVEEGGLHVTTTLDLDLQSSAEAILKEELVKVKALHVTNGGVLVTRPPTGEILAMVGSVDYFATGSGAFNVTTALRQPGSSIKPLNYAEGIDRHIVTPASIFLDVPTCFSPAGQPKQYCPVNYDGQFHGPVSLRTSLGNSFNIPAVKMLGFNGVESFISTASALTITTFTEGASHYGLSLTLGGGEVKMTELAQAFSVFPNQGKPRQLNSILKIENKFGQSIYEFKDNNYVSDIRKPISQPNLFTLTGKRVFSTATTFLISHILADNNARLMEFGPSSALVIPKKTVSVKTGTTDDKKDNWTIGYTPNFLTVVWVGNNDNTPMNPYLASGITGAAPIWNRVMKEVLATQPDLQPIKPENVVGRSVCNDTGTVTQKNPDGTENCPSHFEYIIKGTENVSVIGTGRQLVPVYAGTDKQAPPNETNIEMKEKSVLKDRYSIYCIDCQHDPVPTPSH